MTTPSMPRPDEAGTQWRRLAMTAVAVLLAVHSQFYRSSVGVIAPDLMAELALAPEDLGLVTGSFFVVFAVLQIPFGVLLDRFGARLTVPLTLTVAVAGGVVFAASDTAAGLIAGRTLLGIGFAGAMVGALVVMRRWYASRSFTMAVAVLFASAHAGNLAATAPLAAAATAWGWRTTFLAQATVTAAIALMLFLAVRDTPGAGTRDPESDSGHNTLASVIAGLADLWSNRNLLRVIPMVATGYASVIAILGGWGGSYLHDVHSLDAQARGDVLFAMAVAMLVGTLAYGPLDRWLGTRRGVVAAGAAITAAVFAALALRAGAGAFEAAVLLALLGFFGAYSVVVMTHGMALFPGEVAGRAVTSLNTALMGGAALVQWGAGRIVGLFPAETHDGAEDAYTALFAALAALTLAALIVYRRADDVRPRGQEPAHRARRDDQPAERR